MTSMRSALCWAPPLQGNSLCVQCLPLHRVTRRNILAGDVIVRISGVDKAPHSLTEAAQALSGSVGERKQLHILRNGKIYERDGCRGPSALILSQAAIVSTIDPRPENQLMLPQTDYSLVLCCILFIINYLCLVRSLLYGKTL